jgi:hypothetical protein
MSKTVYLSGSNKYSKTDINTLLTTPFPEIDINDSDQFPRMVDENTFEDVVGKLNLSGSYADDRFEFVELYTAMVVQLLNKQNSAKIRSDIEKILHRYYIQDTFI